MEGTLSRRNYVRDTVIKYPMASAITMGILAILVIILIFVLIYYKNKSGFHTSPLSNLTTGNNNPEWQYGAMDAGNWGPVHREPTAWNMSIYHPGWREGRCQNFGKETLATAPDGSPCTNLDVYPGPHTVCGLPWDPAASAEVEALATIGSLPHHSIAEKRLQRGINAAFDSNLGISDDQLMTVMHNGGAP